MIQKIKNNILLIILVIIAGFICFTNYTPGTFLSGWDTLHPEFNFGLNIEREISGVFRENQGLGAVAGHSDMADLPHILILYIFHFFLPLSFLRYAYIFLALIIGPIGMYFFLYKIVLKNKIASFLGALFYTLNLGTMQQFVVPFEMFVTQYASLPWLFLFATLSFYEEKKRKNLILFALITLLSAPMAFAATLWYVYFLVLIVYLGILSFPKITKRMLSIIGLTLILNLFWILPNIYFAINYGSDVQNANINKLFSKEAFLYNKEFGNIKDLSLLKNFLFDWSVYSGNYQFTKLLMPWIEHLKKPLVESIGLLFSFMFLGGIVYAVKSKNRVIIALFGPLLLSAFLLINDNFPTSYFYNLLQQKIPLFEEAFRFPQDKALGIFTFAFTVLFASFQLMIINFLGRYNNLFLKIFYISTIFVSIFYFMLPAFKGNFISPHMRVEIPKEYFELLSWFQKQNPNSRIANLPIHSPYGWEYYNWYDNTKPSFQGAGFLWFGLKQPILNRDFDRWHPANEQYYREMSHAIYSQDQSKFNNVIKKYDIGYILVDKSIIAPNQEKESSVLFFDEIEILLKENPAIKQVANFGRLLVFESNFGNQFVRVIKNPVTIGPYAQVLYDDFAYSKFNDYITYYLNPKENTIFYPYRNIIDNRNRVDPKIFKLYSQSQKITTDLTELKKTNNDCNFNTAEKPAKEIINGIVRYTSLEGPFCDHYSHTSLTRDQGYLISIKSKNINGLPLWLCISNNLSDRCDVYAQLSSFPTPKEDVFMIPPIDKEAVLNINFNNFGVKKSPSINELNSIEIIPFPYSELSQLEKYSNFSFSKNIEVVALSSSFDKGWKAYKVQIKNQKSKIKNFLATTFPLLFGKELKEHVLVNNWANGWILDGSTAQQLNSSTIAIIFLPQYLQYIGIFLLGGIFIFLVLVYKYKK